MICHNCQYAGNVARGIRVPDQPPLYNLSVYNFGQAEQWHAGCKGGTWCDCQHVIPVRTGTGHPTLNK